MMADRGKRGDVEDWLRDAKTHLIGTSIPWKYLRSQIVAELTTRLLADQKIVLQQQHDQKQQPNNINSSIYNPLFGRPLNDWSLQERLELCEAVKESLNSLSPDLFAAAAEDIRDYVQGHFHLHVYKLLKLKSSSKMNASSKSQLDSKIRTGLRESERTIKRILTKWPDAAQNLVICVNIPLSRDLRRFVWSGRLTTGKVNRDLANAVDFKQVRRNLGTQVYDICHGYMTSMPTLAQLASVFSCVKQLERYTMFVISRDEGLAISVSGGLYDVFNKNSRLKRKFIFSIPFVKVLEYDTLREESIPSAPTLVASNNDYEDGGGQEDFREEGKFGGGNEAKTAQFIEIASSFWNRMPEYWRSGSDTMVDKVTFEVENAMQKVDPNLQSHIMRIGVADDLSESMRQSDGLRYVVSLVSKNLFIDSCHLDVVVYIFDQLLVSSTEFSGNQEMPPFDMWVAWIIVCILTSVRSEAMKCSKLKYLVQFLKQNIPSYITVAMLHQELEKHFVKQLRQRMTEKSSRMQASLLYGHNANNMARFQNFWSMESFAPGNETSLLQWENQASLPSRIEYERWKAKMENNSAMRLNLLMRRWRRAANSIGKLVMLLVRVRDHTNQQMLFNSSAAEAAFRAREPSFQQQIPVSRQDLTIDEPVQVKAPAKLSKKNTNKSIKSKQNLASQAQLKLAKSNQTLQRREEDNFKQAPVENKNIRDSILVEPNTMLGQEKHRLTNLGKIILPSIEKVQYFLGGDKSHDPRIVHIIDRSLRKAKIFDVAIHKAEEQLGLFYSDLNDLDEKRRVFFYETVDDYVELISAEDKKMKRKNTENWNVRSDRILGILATQDQLQTMDKLKSIQGISALTMERVEKLFLGDPNSQPVTILKSLALTHYLERFDPVAQKAVWGKLFKDRKQFLQMIEPDNPDDDKKEVKRRKKRDEYFKKLDELMLDKKNLTEIEEIT